MKIKIKGRITNDELRCYIKQNLKKFFPNKFYIILDKKDIIPRRGDEEIIEVD